MTIKKRPSLRKCINDHCKACIHDPKAAGTWRQQVTLCSVTGCPLHVVRPTTNAPIPESVLDYYQATGAERAQYGCSQGPEGALSEGECPGSHPCMAAS